MKKNDVCGSSYLNLMTWSIQIKINPAMCEDSGEEMGECTPTSCNVTVTLARRIYNINRLVYASMTVGFSFLGCAAIFNLRGRQQLKCSRNTVHV